MCKHGILAEKRCYNAVKNDHIECLNNALTDGCFLASKCVYAAIKYNLIEMLKFLFLQKCPKDDKICFLEAIKKHNLEIFKYLCENLVIEDYVYCYVVKYNFMTGLNFLYLNKYPISASVAVTASKCGYKHILEYYKDTINKKFTIQCCEFAAKYGYLDCLQYLHENGCKWTKNTTRMAATNNHLNCLEYAHKNGCFISYNFLHNVVIKGYYDCLKYCHENGVKSFQKGLLCKYAAENGHLDCLIYLHENNYPWNENTCTGAAGKGHIECLEYAMKNGCVFTIINKDKDIFMKVLQDLLCTDYILKDCVTNAFRLPTRKFFNGLHNSKLQLVHTIFINDNKLYQDTLTTKDTYKKKIKIIINK